MGKTYESLSPELQAWLKQQKLFFVATAPLAQEGHVNCSPKGGDTFRILGEREVAYLDLTGSGIETVAHIQENRRIVIMFCAFDGPPKIVRLHGRAEVVYPSHRDFPQLLALFPEEPPRQGIELLAEQRVLLTRLGERCAALLQLAGQFDFTRRHRLSLTQSRAECSNFVKTF